MTFGVSSIAVSFSPSTFTTCLRPSRRLDYNSCATHHIQCSSPGAETSLTTTEPLYNDVSVTGGAYDFDKATRSLTNRTISTTKKVTIVRHGLSTWNQEKRVQGSSNLSSLTETGVQQAERCRKALANIYFHRCFSSPISRAKSTAEIIWQGREGPLVFLDSLMEAHLFFLEGMKNEDARQMYPKEYITWREDPANFNMNGIYPIRNLWGTATEAWKEILLSPVSILLSIFDANLSH